MQGLEELRSITFTTEDCKNCERDAALTHWLVIEPD